MTNIIWENVLGVFLGFLLKEVILTAMTATKSSCYDKINQKISNRWSKFFCLFIIYVIGSLIMAVIVNPTNFGHSLSFGAFCSIDFFNKIISKEESIIAEIR